MNSNELYKIYNESIELIEEEKLNDWKLQIKKSYEGFYKGADLNEAIEIMRNLQNETIEQNVKDFILKFRSENANYVFSILNIILNFSYKGPDFVETVLGEEISVKEQLKINEIRELNNQYKNHIK